jgi:hypothetical protein
MSKMRVVVNVGVVFDVETYTDAGQILDAIDTKLTKILGPHGQLGAGGYGKHEITGFQTRPCKAATFDRLSMQEQGMAMPSGRLDEAMPMEDPFR